MKVSDIKEALGQDNFSGIISELTAQLIAKLGEEGIWQEMQSTASEMVDIEEALSDANAPIYSFNGKRVLRTIERLELLLEELYTLRKLNQTTVPSPITDADKAIK